MKYFNFIFAVFLILTMSEANAAIQTFTTQSYGTVLIDTIGGYQATIDTANGSLSNALNINFKITSNANISNLKVRALVNTHNVGQFGAFRSSGGSGISLPAILALGNVSNGELPCNCCVENALGSLDVPCVVTGLLSNANAIAYSGTITINNGGSLSYVNNAIGEESYFTASIGNGDTDITLDVNPLVGTSFQRIAATDMEGAYQAEIFIDNIPD